MAIIRTALGTNSCKEIGSTLTISNILVRAGHSLVIGVSGENNHNGPISIIHAGRELKLREQCDNNINGIHASLWNKSLYYEDRIGDIVATWASGIGKRAMFATSLNNMQIKTRSVSKAEIIETDNPEAGTMNACVSGVNENFAIAFFASAIPASGYNNISARLGDDTIWQDAAIGQIASTSGDLESSNINIVEIFLPLENFNPVKTQLQNTPIKTWTNALMILGCIDSSDQISYLEHIRNKDISLRYDVIHVFSTPRGAEAVSNTNWAAMPVSGYPDTSVFANSNDRDNKEIGRAHV